ncbi:S-adenosyl-L-methionine-dependent methyltransferase [Xylariaceae sp. FL1272]|nr:S-adenosyl-L-methionine-dependent methyltransferase [Xylariaceae sp. FL1272]
MESRDYILENDNEAKRLSDQHACIKHAMGDKLIIAPVDLTRANLRVLDTGTSDGTWLIDFRSQLPSPETATLVGTDISSARFPLASKIPENISFQIQDMFQPWPEELHNRFDFVHQRLLLAGSGTKGSEVVAELFKVVAPGGWVQLIESTRNVGADDGPAMHQFLALLQEMFAFMGTDTAFPDKMEGWARDAGFTNVNTKDFPYYLGAKIENPILRAQSLSSMKMAVTGIAGWAKVDTLPTRFLAELEKQGGNYPIRVVWGQKPQA